MLKKKAPFLFNDDHFGQFFFYTFIPRYTAKPTFCHKFTLCFICKFFFYKAFNSLSNHHSPHIFLVHKQTFLQRNLNQIQPQKKHQVCVYSISQGTNPVTTFWFIVLYMLLYGKAVSSCESRDSRFLPFSKKLISSLNLTIQAYVLLNKCKTLCCCIIGM